jgi:succinyl-CoA synthetase beta subunit
MTDEELKRYLGSRPGFLEHEAKALLAEMGLSVPRSLYLPAGRPLPRRVALGYPLVAKAVSEKMASKTEAGGIGLGIADGAELEEAVSSLMAMKAARGVLIEEAAPGGTEVIVGGVYDPQFGPAVMFGMGGVLVELYKDVAFALAPLGLEDALWLTRQVRGNRLIDGYRGGRPLDREALIRVVVAVSRIMETGEVQEINLNPVALYHKGAIVLDAKISKRAGSG